MQIVWGCGIGRSVPHIVLTEVVDYERLLLDFDIQELLWGGVVWSR
jgi:hypothetical protein